MKSFLENARPVIGNGGLLLRLVTGNQSADMDSVVSAIAYAFLFHTRYPEEPPYFPLVNITKDELRLRRDIVLLLKAHSITEDHLLFLDDLDVLASLQLVLVDHCGLQGDTLIDLYEKKKIEVVGIIDHHADEHRFTLANPRIIRTNGSCSSLVFNYWHEQLRSKNVDLSEIVSLLLGPLLIDTTNLSAKVEEGDEKAFAQYKSILEAGPIALENATYAGTIDPYKDFYKQLKTAKKDWAGFSFHDVLRKDYKLFDFNGYRFGFSSCGKSISWILSKFSEEEIVKTLLTLKREARLDAIVITTSYTQSENEQYTREFCFYTSDDKLKDLAQYCTVLDLDQDIYNKKDVSGHLELINKQLFFAVHNQKNLGASRKQVVPAVQQAVEKYIL